MRFKEKENIEQGKNPFPFEIKEGVNVEGINPRITSYLISLGEEYRKEIFVTSGREGNHSDKSRHYSGNALDLRMSEKLFRRIYNDPNRFKWGLTLLDPNHGTAKHLHLSYGDGSENDLDIYRLDQKQGYKRYGDVDYSIAYDSKGNGYDYEFVQNLARGNNGVVNTSTATPNFNPNTDYSFLIPEIEKITIELQRAKEAEELRQKELIENKHKANLEKKIQNFNAFKEMVSSFGMDFVELKKDPIEYS